MLRVARALAKAAPFRSAAATGGRPLRVQAEALREGVDMLIATPGRLAEHIRAGNVELDGCMAMVLDEVDILLGEKRCQEVVLCFCLVALRRCRDGLNVPGRHTAECTLSLSVVKTKGPAPEHVYSTPDPEGSCCCRR